MGCGKAIYCGLVSTSRNITRLRFSHLELVRLLERTGSLRAAAAALHQTQSALSKQLKEIESLLGCALFERTRRGLRARPEGLVVVRGAGVLVAELGHLREELLLRDRAGALLRVGAPPFVAISLLPAVFARLLARDPPVHARLTEERVPRLYEALLAGELDALVTSTLADPPQGQKLRHEKLHDGEIVVIARPAHPLARRRAVSWQALAQERWVLPGRDSFVRRLADEMFLRAGLDAPQPAVESTNPLTNVRLVAAGLGLGIVPAPVARDGERQGLVRRLHLSPAIATVPVALVTRGEANPRAAMLREALLGAK
jgi:DNA-binding transcriptional LysR family regulator